MKIKDLEKTVNIAWSPAAHHPIMLAAGTSAQQLDASFNTSATLDVYSLNLPDASMDLLAVASTPSDHRFHKIVWGPGGTIVGGCDAGILQIYDATKLTTAKNTANTECLVSQQDKHTGAVAALDFNQFQHNLLASGAGDAEIFIWDLNNTSTPMTPGAKCQPHENVQSLSWNRQVQHILATAFANRCVVWDLRKNEPIIKLSDAAPHIRWKTVCWHPEVATQLCLASEDDQTPVIQLWDLRFATSPLKVLENHARGVLAVDWCARDADLLISCAKDNRILCWNPNSNETKGEVLAEVAHTVQWNFDVAWCPRNPAVFAAASFDGHVSVYSLMGGKQQQVQTSNKIADSFPGMDGYVQAPLPQQAPPVTVDLAKAPKWLKRPVAATFAFGGKLISFENEKPRNVLISQVVTEPDLIKSANDLDEALESGNYADYCRQKADLSANQHDRYIWHFLKANFEQNPKLEMLNLLGFSPDDVNNAIAKKTGHLGRTEPNENTDDPNSMFDNLSISGKNTGKSTTVPYKIQTGDDTDGLITQAILVGNIETAVDLCIESNRMADALIIAMTGGADLLARTQHRYLQQSTGYVSALVSALVSENWTDVVTECHVDSWREALAALLTYCNADEVSQLCEKLGARLENESNGNRNLVDDAQLCYICAGSFQRLVSSWCADPKASRDPKKLQELVELVTFMQKAIERRGRNVDVTGNLAELLSKYAILLASQGCMAGALNYLGAATSDASLNELRDRLYCHLGHKNAYNQQQNVLGGRKTSAPRTSFGSFSQAWGGGAPPPKTYSPGPSSAAAAVPRSKYVVDPSVQSGGGGFGGMRTAPMNAAAAAPLMGAPPVPLMPVNAAAKAPIQNQPQMMSSMYNTNAVAGAGAGVAQPPPLPTPPTGAAPHTHDVGHPMMMVAQAPPGWNDPPVVTKTIRPQPKNTSVLPPPPITHPLFGGGQQPADNTAAPNNGYIEPQYNTPPYNPAQYNPVQYNPAHYNPTQQPSPSTGSVAPSAPTVQRTVVAGGGGVAPSHSQSHSGVPMAHEAVPKAPVPEEHMYLQTVFNELQAQCLCAANNPQTKRKLEDVSRKLETLYDMLRAHKLSQQTLNGLHQMVQLVQIGDYTNGLGLHTQLVSGPDFAQIASFMPGIKVLLQCALQLQVYLR